MSQFDGIWVPMVTPFRQGKIDFHAAQELANYLVFCGVQGLVLGGTTGEGNALDKNEQQQLLVAVHEAVGKYCPLMFGVGGSNTRELVDKVKRFNNTPLAGFLISPPCYVRPSQEGIRMHFNAIAAATELPVVLYNVPARTGTNINASTVAELARNPQFIAIKECGSQVSDLLAQEKIAVLCGNDDQLFADLSSGARGAISAAAHIRPDLFVQLYQLIQTGELIAAQQLFEQLLPLIKLLFSEPNPAPVKAALAIHGLIENELRLPMTSMSALGAAALKKELDVINNLDWSVGDSTTHNHLAFLNR